MAAQPFKFAQAEHAHPSRNWHNCCGIFVRTAFGRPSIGDYDGDGSADAEDMWKRAEHKHYETDPAAIPRGVPVWWSGGSADNWHIAFSRGMGTATVWGTDLVRDGQVDVYPIAAVTRTWGMPLVGWAEDLNGARVWTPPAKHAATQPPADPRPDAGPKVVDLHRIDTPRKRAALEHFARNQNLRPDQIGELVHRLNVLRRLGELGDPTGRAVFYAAVGWDKLFEATWPWGKAPL